METDSKEKINLPGRLRVLVSYPSLTRKGPDLGRRVVKRVPVGRQAQDDSSNRVDLIKNHVETWWIVGQYPSGCQSSPVGRVRVHSHRHARSA